MKSQQPKHPSQQPNHPSQQVENPRQLEDPSQPLILESNLMAHAFARTSKNGAFTKTFRLNVQKLAPILIKDGILVKRIQQGTKL